LANYGKIVVAIIQILTILPFALFGGRACMLRTITVGSCVSVQGLVQAQLADGRVAVAVGDKTFVGYPVPPVRKS
jgi:NADPH-dependent glutamate synthase beta subunit-like oxidoreductase